MKKSFLLTAGLGCLALFLAACGDGGGETGPTGGSATVDTGSSVGAIKLAATGQNSPYGPGDDGTLQIGVTPSKSPRFAVNYDGTVTDTMTGLMWMQRVNCWRGEHLYVRCQDKDGLGIEEADTIADRDNSDGEPLSIGYQRWDGDANGYVDEDGDDTNGIQRMPLLFDCNALTDSQPYPMTASYQEALPGDGRVHHSTALQYVDMVNTNFANCGHSSQYEDWRLPTVIELESVLNFSSPAPADGSALPAGHPFDTNNTTEENIWTATDWANGPTTTAWTVEIDTGRVVPDIKTHSDDNFAKNIVWLVRNDSNYFN